MPPHSPDVGYRDVTCSPRYRKGDLVKLAHWEFEWWGLHRDIMTLAADAVLPLGITAIFASGGDHDSEHANWGYYMIAAVAVQLLTGSIRARGLEGKIANYSLFHRVSNVSHRDGFYPSATHSNFLYFVNTGISRHGRWMCDPREKAWTSEFIFVTLL